MPRQVITIDQETLRANVEHNIKRFEHVIVANGIHMEQIYD